MSAARWLGLWRERLLASVLIVSAIVTLSAQAMTITTTAGTLRVRPLRWTLIEGEILNRLRNGRSLRVDLELMVLAEPGGSPATAARQSFNLSFDLWEERVAVTRLGTSPRSISHLRTRDAEVWCLENLTLPVTDLRRFSPSVPFWIRLSYRVQDPVVENEKSRQTFTLRRLIDLFSQQREDGQISKSVEAGPFRLTE